MTNHQTVRMLGIALLLPIIVPLRSSAGSNDVKQSSPVSAIQIVSGDDWDWRDMLPYLYEAAALTPEQGLKELLENSRVLRAYMAGDVQSHCSARVQLCGARLTDSALQSEITKEIDSIVKENLFSNHKVSRVHYALERQPFPFTDIVGLRDAKQRDAYLILDFADNSYTADQVRQKYGAPYDTTIFQWFSMYKYRLDTSKYVAQAAFTINPIDGYVQRVAISLKRKDPHK